MEDKKKNDGTPVRSPLKGAIPVAIIVAIFVIPIMILLSMASGLLNGFTGMFSVPPQKATVILSSAVSSTLLSRAQLITAENISRDYQVRVNVSGGIANALGYGATYETDVVFKIGYNFARPQFQVTSDDENHVKITMPPVELLACSMTPPEANDRSTSLTADWDAAKELGEYMLMTGSVQDVLANADNFDEARTSAQQTITQIVRGISPDAVLDIVFLQTDQPRIDDTCRLRTPVRWTYDTVDDSWKKE